jgi:hypothetical protein
MLDRLIKSYIAFRSETFRSTKLSLKRALSNQMNVYQLSHIISSVPFRDECSISRANPHALRALHLKVFRWAPGRALTP